MNNRNFTHTSNFIFGTNLFSEDVTYYAQTINVPGISFGHIESSTRSVKFNLQSDTMEFSPLNITLIVDEQLENWKQIFKTLKRMREQDKGTGEKVEEYLWIEIHDDNSQKILHLDFYGAMLESLGDLTFNTTSEDEIVTTDIVIKYDYYDIKE